MTTVQRFYSVSEFATVLGFPDAHPNGRGYKRVLAAIHRREIRARKIGKEWRVPATEVQRLGGTEAVAS